MTPLVPCMGGWCRMRDECAHYRLASAWLRPVERLCSPGMDKKVAMQSGAEERGRVVMFQPRQAVPA